MKVALIGYGYWGKILEKYIIESPFKLKYIFSRSQVENKFTRDVVFTSDLNLILSDGEIEAVFVATSIDSHYSICKLVLQSHKHVFCEKTTTNTNDELEELYNISNLVNKILYTDYIYVTSPSIRYIRSIFSEIGNLISINGNIEQFGNFYQNDNVFEVIGSHLLSVIFYLVPDKVMQITFQNEFTLDSTLAGTINLKFDSGVKVNLHCSLVSNEKIRKLQFIGDKGIITYFQNKKPNVVFIKYHGLKNKLELLSKSEMNFDETNGLNYSITDFYRCISVQDYLDNKLISKKVLDVVRNSIVNTVN